MEPISTTIITALVGLYTAYTTYKVGMAQAEAKGEPTPAKSPEADRGEQVAQVVEMGIQQYGDKREKRALQDFQDDPEWYQNNMQRALAAVAKREPTFAQQLQRVAEQTNVAQMGGVRGTATVQGNNTGINIGANTGSISQSNQTIDNQASNRGAQGTFHGPVNFGKGKGKGKDE
jgi:hypothetical protein